MIVRSLQLLFLVLFTALVVFPQKNKTVKPTLEHYFEKKQIILKIDMPADNSGLDVLPENPVMMDDSVRSKRINDFGVSLHKDDIATVTNIAVSGKKIGFLLNGGGYNVPPMPPLPIKAPPSADEIRWKTELKLKTTPPARIRYLRKLIADAEAQREAEYQRKLAEYKKKVRDRNEYIQQGRLNKGSRFTLKFTQTKTSLVTSEELMKWLGDYVDFSPIINGVAVKPEIITKGPIKKTASVVGVKPYFGQWKNSKGETLWIESARITLNNVTMRYKEICRIAGVFAVQIVKGPADKPGFIVIKTSDSQLEMTYYYQLDDLNNGTNSVRKEIWSKH